MRDSFASQLHIERTFPPISEEVDDGAVVEEEIPVGFSCATVESDDDVDDDSDDPVNFSLGCESILRTDQHAKKNQVKS